VVDVAGQPVSAFTVGENGRGAALPAPPPEPTVALVMDRETFVLLAGGRRAPEAGAVTVAGDRDLATRVLDLLAVTP